MSQQPPSMSSTTASPPVLGPPPAAPIPESIVTIIREAITAMDAETDPVARAAWANRVAQRFADLRDDALAECLNTPDLMRGGMQALAHRAQVSMAVLAQALASSERRHGKAADTTGTS